jgi:hypothetical protein
MADLINTEVDKEANNEGGSSNYSYSAYASVVNMKVGGTLGDERTITVHSSPAVAKKNVPAVPVGLLKLDKHTHWKVLEYLKPNWVLGTGGGREERCVCMGL